MNENLIYGISKNKYKQHSSDHSMIYTQQQPGDDDRGTRKNIRNYIVAPLRSLSHLSLLAVVVEIINLSSVLPQRHDTQTSKRGAARYLSPR